MKRIFQTVFLTVATLIFSGMILPVANAQNKYDIKEMTPEVKAALESRKARYEQLRNLKSKGVVGENNRGYVEILTVDASAKDLVESENKDRRVIYKTIEQQNNLTDALDTIEKVFAQVQNDKASPGDKIQDDSGQWITK